jgi:hypothetical protein
MLFFPSLPLYRNQTTKIREFSVYEATIAVRVPQHCRDAAHRNRRILDERLFEQTVNTIQLTNPFRSGLFPPMRSATSTISPRNSTAQLCVHLAQSITSFET